MYILNKEIGIKIFHNFVDLIPFVLNFFLVLLSRARHAILSILSHLSSVVFPIPVLGTSFTKPANPKVLSAVRQIHTPTILAGQASKGFVPLLLPHLVLIFAFFLF